MCGRFTLATIDPEALAAELCVPVEQIPEVAPRFNIAPTDPHVVVRMHHEVREVVPARWGLVNSWAKDTKSGARNINARAETVDERPTFREAFEKRRCVVPADGFYEWTGPPKNRQPFWFHRASGQLLLFAGLYEWRKQGDAWDATFTIVTTEANGLLSSIHDRMPVILEPDAVDEWIDPGNEDRNALKSLLVPAGEEVLVRRRVSPLANNVRNQGPELFEEVPAFEELLG